MVDRPTRVATVVTRLEGGAGVLALRGARSLDPNTHAVTLITGSGGRLLDDAATAGLETVLEPSLHVSIDPMRDLRAVHRLTRLFERGDFDVVHTHCAKAGAVGRIAAHRAGIARIVHTYHGFPFHEFQRSPRRNTYVAIERFLGRVTDVGLCVGTGVAVEALRRGLLPPERVRTIGVPVNRRAPVRTRQTRLRARRALGLAPSGTVVGAVGRLTYQKAPEDFLTALRALSREDVTGLWVGSGEREGAMRELAQRALPETRVELAGERADVVEVLPAFDVFVLPSRYEGLPLALVEAMVCGVPVVATAVNAVADVVVPGVTGMLVPPGRPEQLAAAIGHVLDSPAEAERRCAAARAKVDERYTEAALAQVLTSVYRGEAEGRTGEHELTGCDPAWPGRGGFRPA